MHIETLPDRNFVAGYPKNLATHIAYSDEGFYFEAFVCEYASIDEFKADAAAYFTSLISKA